MTSGIYGPKSSDPTKAICRKCDAEKTLDSFSKDPSKANGRRPYCRTCIALYRQTEAVKLRKKARMPWRDKTAREYHKEYNKRPHAAEENRRRANEYRAKYPERIAARQAVKRAIKSFVLHWPMRCEQCGVYGKTEAHHYKGYAPENHLEVLWLCRSCHKRAHISAPEGGS